MPAIRPDSLFKCGAIGAALVSALWAQDSGPGARHGARPQPPRPDQVVGKPGASYALSRYPFGLHVINDDVAGAVEVGGRWSRHMVLWKDVEPRRGEIRNLERVVPGFNRLTDAGFEILPRFISVNPWAQDERINRLNAEAAAAHKPMGSFTYIGMPTDLASYRRFVATIVESFDGDRSGDARGLKRGIKYWQVENEWDWRWKDSPERFVEFLKVAYETIKAADPEAKVVLGGISKLAPDAFHAGMLGESYEFNGKVVTPATLERQEHFREEHALRTYVLEHGHPYFDIIAFHQYGLYRAIDQEVEYVRGIMRAHHYEKPLWMTEVGGPFVPYGEAYTEDRQAQEVIKYHVTALASGVEVIFWSTYQPTPEWGPAFTNTALLDARRRRKPAYDSYKLMTSKLGDATRVESVLVGARGRLVRFIRKTRQPVYVAWSDGGAGAGPPGAGSGAPALDRLRSVLGGELEGKTLEVTSYDGSVQTVRDLQGVMDGLLRKGPAFIEVR